MTNEHARGGKRSERGMALIMVLLLLAVVSSLATGLTMNGQIEVAMASNEATYAGARAAAEAGMNRAIAAIAADTTTDLLALYLDEGDLGALFTGTAPYPIGDRYSYIIELFDDDDPALYPTPLSQAQLDQMNEPDNDPTTNQNDRLILRVTGLGPNGTSVSVARILETVGTTETSTTTTTIITNPALLVNGNLSITGNIDITGQRGNVHANGNMSLAGGAYEISGDATAAGTFTAGNGTIGGVAGGGRPSVNVPDIDANDYYDLATHILDSATGTVTPVSGAPACSNANCGWSFAGGTWTLGHNADPGTFFANGNVNIAGNPNGGGPPNARQPLPLSVIATGSIRVTGTPILGPNNPNNPIQFVTNGDLHVAGNADLDRTLVEGQSLVREQLSISGNPDLRGQIIVQDVTDCNPCSSVVTANSVTGNMTITYDGSFGDMETEIITTETLPTSWVNNVAGWMEGM